MRAMPRKTVFVTAAMIVVAGSLAMGILNTPEKRTLRYYESHIEDINKDVYAVKAGGVPAARKSISVNYWDGEDDWSSKHAVIEYTVVSRGMVPSSKYYGFFYSFDDVPVAFQNADEELIPVSDNEWKWYDEGDNNGVVRRLDDNWFYFEAGL